MSDTSGVAPGTHGYQPQVDLELELPAEPAAAGLARRAVIGFLTDRGLVDVVDDSELLVSELVTNAVRYGGGVVRLVVVDLGECVRLEVTDGRPDTLPVPQAADVDAIGGRGLALVSSLSRRWGVDVPAAGQVDGHARKTVWAELAVGRPRRT